MMTAQRQQEGGDEDGELPPSLWTAHGDSSPEAGVCVAQRERSASTAARTTQLADRVALVVISPSRAWLDVMI